LTSWASAAAVFVLILVVAIFYVPFFITFGRLLDQQTARKNFSRGLQSILSRVADDEEAVPQIEVVFKKVAEHLPATRARHKSATDLAEDVLYRAESFSSVRYRFLYGFNLGVSNLRQLADDIEVLEGSLDVQAKRNQISLLISVVGVVLTLVFGALTVIQWIAQFKS
jgi:hypothetical protein